MLERSGGSCELLELGSTTSELTGVRGMSPVAGGSSDSRAGGLAAVRRGGQLPTSSDASSPARRLRCDPKP